MKIDKLTITGADNNTPISELLAISNKYPFIEWAILFSKNKEGQQRYPTGKYINELVRTTKIPLSAHFCGWYAKQVLEECNYGLITQLPINFERVQLNYNFKNSSGYKLNNLLEFARAYPFISIVLQYNKSNADILKQFATEMLPFNIHFLYDASGGNGKEIERIDASIGNQYTGYAGGISPENVEKICEMITTDAEQVNTWVDLESGVRTNNEFDLAKADDIAQKVSKFI